MVPTSQFSPVRSGRTSVGGPTWRAHMLISAPAASRILEEETGLVRQQSRRVLLSGLAGAGVRAGGALPYDDGRVRALAVRPEADRAELLARCPGGVIVVRLGRGSEPGPADPGRCGPSGCARRRGRASPVLLASLTGLARQPEASSSGSHGAHEQVAVDVRPTSGAVVRRTA
jgi:hypothetical protein